MSKFLPVIFSGPRMQAVLEASKSKVSVKTCPKCKGHMIREYTADLKDGHSFLGRWFCSCGFKTAWTNRARSGEIKKTKAELEKELEKLERLIRKAEREHDRWLKVDSFFPTLDLLEAWGNVYEAAKKERGRK